MKPRDRLGPYEILTPIGVGGMGEVYKARDTRLNRNPCRRNQAHDQRESLNAK